MHDARGAEGGLEGEVRGPPLCPARDSPAVAETTRPQAARDPAPALVWAKEVSRHGGAPMACASNSLAANQDDQRSIEGDPAMQGSQHVLRAQRCVSVRQQRAQQEAQRPPHAEPTSSQPPGTRGWTSAPAASRMGSLDLWRRAAPVHPRRCLAVSADAGAERSRLDRRAGAGGQ